MKTFKLINTYFFGSGEIEKQDGIWFYGFILFMAVVFITLTIAKF